MRESLKVLIVGTLYFFAFPLAYVALAYVLGAPR